VGPPALPEEADDLLVVRLHAGHHRNVQMPAQPLIYEILKYWLLDLPFVETFTKILLTEVDSTNRINRKDCLNVRVYNIYRYNLLLQTYTTTSEQDSLL
jgi:hypothetical protein